MSHARACYSRHVREKDFITKVHKHLPKYIYSWKINDPYHGGVQQRACLQKHLNHKIPAFVVVGSGDLVYVTQNFTLEKITVKEFTNNAVSFVQYIDNLVGFCLGGAEL